MIAELGGKNAIIVDEDADLDEAVLGVLASAMGYAGQKCSACSRVVVIGSAQKPFHRRLAEAIRSIPIGPAEDPATRLGPVVDADAQERILRYLEIGRQEGRLLAEAPVPPELAGRGYYVPAAAFTDCPPEGRLCQDEIFGPILAVQSARDLDEALALAQNTPYALTGGFYSRSPEHIARVAAGVPRRQSVHQPQDHGRAGGPPAVRRGRDVRRRLEGGRAGLPAAIPGSAHGDGVGAAARFCAPPIGRAARGVISREGRVNHKQD